MSGFFHGAIAMTAIAATIPNNAKYGPKTASLLTGSVKPPTVQWVVVQLMVGRSRL